MFITRRDPEALELIRHDAAHVLAEAVQALYPGTQVTIGPSIENGFYYDFARNDPFTPDDFPAIEAKMREIVGRGEKFVREEIDRDEAIAFFQAKGEKYKAQLIQDLPATETISLYKQGDWLDLCRGPHMRSTADVGTAFKLMKVAGAYWRGDHRNAMLSPHLRHRLARPEGTRRLPPPAGGSRAPRPPQDRQGNGPVPYPGGSGRLDLLAPQGLEAVPHGGGLYAPPPRCQRLPGGEDAAAGRPLAVGEVRALGELPRRTCSSPRCRTRTSSSR